MGYDILTRVIEFTESDLNLEVRLKKVARLLVKDFPFDSCAIYSWDEKEKLFRLCLTEGARNDRVRSYGENDGLPGLVKKTNRPVEAYKPQPESIRWGQTEDKGLAGFKSASVYPLKYRGRWLGLLYLKAGKKLALSPRRKKMLYVITQLITSNLRCNQHSYSLKNAYTKLKDTQTKLLQAEKLLVLGELSASLAHEIKNPLVSIGGFASRLKKKVEPDSPLMVYVNYISKEVGRLEDIMDSILAYTQEKGVIFSREDVNSIIEEALSLFSDAIQHHKIKVVKGFASEPLPVMADRQQLKIAFDNLFVNAIQSMEGGGKLTVETSGTEDWVVADVTDSGGGIDPRLIGNIFNPFFTTKKYGTGLGLDITHRIVTKHKGHIDVVNNVGQGVTFSVKLPHVDRGPAAREVGQLK
jgi:nitrogen-specific signal transduction histidine kinase